MATPPRGQFYDVLLDLVSTSATFGKPITSNITITVYVAVPQAASPQTTFASIFSAESGAGTPGNPFNISSTGEINFWAGPGTYDIKIHDTTVPARFADKIIRWDVDPYDLGTQTAMIADSAVTSAKINDGTIVLADLASSLQQLLVPTGSILAYGGLTAPTGFLLCNGQVVSSTTYAALDALFGAAAGAGAQHAFNAGASPGAGTFKLPDLRSRSPLGSSMTTGAPVLGNDARGVALTSRALGAILGEEAHPLTTAELASHSHGVTDPGHLHTIPTWAVDTGNPAGNGTHAAAGSNVSSGNNVSTNSSSTGISIQNTGSGTAHNNIQPSQGVGFIIKT